MQFFVDVTHCFANQDANIQAILIFCRSESNIFSQFSYCSCFVAQSRNVQSISRRYIFLGAVKLLIWVTQHLQQLLGYRFED